MMPNLVNAVRNLLTAASELNLLVTQDESRYEAWEQESHALEDACTDTLNALRTQEPDVVNKLRIFAYHISTLVQANAGAKFGLSFWGDVYVDVEVQPTHEGKNDPTWNSYLFTIDGKQEQVGNSAGACKQYAALCAPAFLQ